MTQRHNLQLESIRPQMTQLLASMRDYLQMEVIFISELRGAERIINFIDAPADFPLAVGSRATAKETYCRQVADGLLPQIMPNTADNPIAARMPITTELGVGSLISVPIYRDDGVIYGALCCASTSAQPDLGRREHEFARMAGAVGQGLIHKALATSENELEQIEGLDRILRTRAIRTVFQPIYRLRDTRLVAFEALSRFPVEPKLSPDKWFAVAAKNGRGIELETLAALQAVELLDRPGVSLSLNLSPEAILNGSLHQILFGHDPSRYVVEITEHAPIDNYADINAALNIYRSQGLRIAIDDVGAGHSSFRHILELSPQIIKLDISLTRNIDKDRGRKSLASALTTFSRDMGCEVVAEGVETDAEMANLRAVGVTKIQGYYVGRPVTRDLAQHLPLQFILADAA